MEVSVNGAFAHLQGSEESYIELGKNSWGIMNPALGEVQRAIIDGHNQVEKYIKKFAPEEVSFSIAMLGLLSNDVLPKKLRHQHAALYKVLDVPEGNTASIQPDELNNAIDLVEAGLDEDDAVGLLAINSLRVVLNSDEDSLSKYKVDKGKNTLVRK